MATCRRPHSNMMRPERTFHEKPQRKAKDAHPCHENDSGTDCRADACVGQAGASPGPTSAIGGKPKDHEVCATALDAVLIFMIDNHPACAPGAAE